jgi:hypothetical protein
MKRTSIRSLMLIALGVFAGGIRADVTAGPAVTDSGEPAQGFIVAVPPDSNAAAANKIAEEPQPQRLPPTEVQAYREDRAACDRRQGTGQEACRAQLAAKYAEMDKLCRSLSVAEFPTCIKSAYSAD